MKAVPLGAIARYHKQLNVIIRVPKWIVQVPLVAAVDEEIVEMYARYFVSDGMMSNKAWQRAKLTVQMTYEQGYIEGLRECLARRSAEYAEMWPNLMQKVGEKIIGKRRIQIVELRGFNPQIVQSMYVPFQNTGRGGLDYVKGMLADMGRKVQ